MHPFSGGYVYRFDPNKKRLQIHFFLRVSQKELDGGFMTTKSFFSAKRVTGIAVLLALVVVLQAFGGSIAIGVVQLNFTLIPIVLGAVLFGPLVGGLLGFACGVVVFVQVMMGLGPFYAIIWTHTPLLAALTCIVKTTVAGLVAGWLFQLLAKKNTYVALFVASGAVPIINTGLFIVGCLLMNDSITIFQNTLPDFLGMNMFVFILVGLVTFNFFIELAINLIVAPTLHRVIGVVDKRFQKEEI